MPTRASFAPWHSHQRLIGLDVRPDRHRIQAELWPEFSGISVIIVAVIAVASLLDFGNNSAGLGVPPNRDYISIGLRLESGGLAVAITVAIAAAILSNFDHNLIEIQPRSDDVDTL